MGLPQATGAPEAGFTRHCSEARMLQLRAILVWDTVSEVPPKSIPYPASSMLDDDHIFCYNTADRNEALTALLLVQ